MSGIKVIEGEIFIDERGQISSLNSFDFKGVERFYFIRHLDKNVVRGWHGHQFEKKWFYCVKGSFAIALIKPDNWEKPSKELEPEVFLLNEEKSDIICVPEGYANCIKARENNSILLVFSGKKVPEAYNDSWRYNKDLWINWNNF